MQQVKKLNTIFPQGALTDEEAIELYYEILSPDFTDETFIRQLNVVVKDWHKFPPPAAFYKGRDTVAPMDEEERGFWAKQREKIMGEGGEP